MKLIPKKNYISESNFDYMKKRAKYRITMKVNIIYMFYFRYMYLDFIVFRSILKNS